MQNFCNMKWTIKQSMYGFLKINKKLHLINEEVLKKRLH